MVCSKLREGSLGALVHAPPGPGLLEVAVYPYGNAHQTQNKDGSWNFTCQHDKPECDGNLIEVTTVIIRTRAANDPSVLHLYI